MVDPIVVIDMVAFVLSVIALYMLGNKKKACFVIFSLTNLLVGIIAVQNNLLGLLLMQFTYFGFNIWNWKKWKKDET